MTFLVGILSAVTIAVGLGTLIWLAKVEYDIHADITDEEIRDQLELRNK